MAILVGLSCGNAFATTAILTAQDGSMSSSFTNAANWAINGQPSGAVGAPLDPAVDYVNPGDVSVRKWRTPHVRQRGPEARQRHVLQLVRSQR